ncbi:TPA: hypothetical protein ACGXP4_003900 [Bacillus cereus]
MFIISSRCYHTLLIAAGGYLAGQFSAGNGTRFAASRIPSPAN